VEQLGILVVNSAEFVDFPETGETPIAHHG
jgi:hypothetical protein